MTAAIPLTLESLRAAYGRGTRPARIIHQVYRRIEEISDPGIFLCLFDEAEVLATAEALGAFDGRPLWGVPFVVKDNIDVAGKPTTAACPDFAYVADETAFVVARLQEAGALLIGKTNLDQFATGLVGVRTPYGAPKNAIDPQIVPGGSSGGSGVAVAHGIASFSLGSDTAGSGRVPAALNNIVGLKPTLGALSASGLVPACRTLDTISIFALTVEDAYTAFQAAAVYDPADGFACPVAAPALSQTQRNPIIGVPSADSIRFEGDAAQQASFGHVVEALSQDGAEIREIDFTPLYDIAEMLYYGPWVAERYAATEALMTTSPESLFPVTRKIIGSALSKTAVDAFKGIYRLKDLIRAVEPQITACDALCVPSIPTFYSVSDLEADPVLPNNKLGTYTNFVNLMNLSAITVPAPPRDDGRPGSVTFIAGAGEDAKIAALAHQIEAMGPRTLGATPWPVPTGRALPPAPSDRIQIAVCGAHMSGLPLNGHLTERGGRFLRQAATAPDYAFYALPGTPARPGLVRNGAGASVVLEIWEMPEAQFGSFMKTIPAPLGIGTLHLSDGGTVQGFLCEAAATDGATDITHLADWRRYLASTH